MIVLAAVFLLVALALGLAWRASRRLAAPFPDLVDSLSTFLSGNLDQRLTLPSRQAARDELSLLAEQFNQLADDYRSIFNSISRRDTLQKDAAQTHEQTFTQIVQSAVKAGNLEELLQTALPIINRDFSCLYTAAYFFKEAPGGQPGHPHSPTLIQSASAAGFNAPPGPDAQPVTDRSSTPEGEFDKLPVQVWLGFQAISAGRSLIDSYVSPINLLPDDSMAGSPSSLLEAAIPIQWGRQTLGVIDLVSSRSVNDVNGQPFSPLSARALADLQRIADLLALAAAGLASHFLPVSGEASGLENAPRQPLAGEFLLPGQAQATQLLTFLQISQAIARADTTQAVGAALANALESAPYPAVFLLRQPGAGGWKALYSSASSLTSQEAEPAWILETPDRNELSRYFAEPAPIILSDLVNPPVVAGQRTPAVLEQWLAQYLGGRLGCAGAGLIPVLRGGELSALLVVGRRDEHGEAATPPLSASLLSPYASLAELAVAALTRIASTSEARNKLAEIQMISNISQTISLESNLATLYPVIHQQLESVMGKLSSLAIALFDSANQTIRIPYLFEEGALLQIPAFPMGEGLTSIVLRTRKPLLLVENVEQQSLALGAKVAGSPALSWLGVPMIYAGDAIGAIIIQDVRQEHRFDEDDQNLLSTLAAQVAVVVRNARLLETAQQRAEQERYLNQITTRIRRAPDIQAILKTTAEELGAALAVQHASVRLGVSESALSAISTPEAER